MNSDNMKKLRLEKGVTQREVAQALNIDTSTYTRYERGQSEPSFQVLDKLAEYFGVPTDVIMGRVSVEAAAWVPEMKRVPMLGTIACGVPIGIGDQLPEEYCDIDGEVRCDFCLRCKGDSMIGARIYDGDIVFVRSQPDVDDGQIAAVIIDEEETTLKRVYKTMGGVILQAENPHYRPIAITIGGGHSVRILGLAVAFRSWIK